MIKKKSSKKKSDQELMLEVERQREMEKAVNDMMDSMIEAANLDRVAYNSKQPAIRKLMLSKKLYESLKNLEFQSLFLQKGGCNNLAQWMDTYDDGSFPNINLVMGVLECLDTLNLEEDNIKDENIYNTI